MPITTNPEPTIVAIPGAWLPPSTYDPTFSILNAQGYETVTIPLPSVSDDPERKGFEDDVAVIRSTVSRLVEDEGKEVVVVMHSYSGMPGSEALKGLGRREREGNNLEGGVIRYVPSGFHHVRDLTACKLTRAVKDSVRCRTSPPRRLFAETRRRPVSGVDGELARRIDCHCVSGEREEDILQ